MPSVAIAPPVYLPVGGVHNVKPQHILDEQRYRPQCRPAGEIGPAIRSTLSLAWTCVVRVVALPHTARIEVVIHIRHALDYFEGVGIRGFVKTILFQRLGGHVGCGKPHCTLPVRPASISTQEIGIVARDRRPRKRPREGVVVLGVPQHLHRSVHRRHFANSTNRMPASFLARGASVLLCTS